MKMKRIAAMLLAGAMLTGLCACGGSGGGDKKAAGSGGGSADGAKISMILKTTSAGCLGSMYRLAQKQRQRISA